MTEHTEIVVPSAPPAPDNEETKQEDEEIVVEEKIVAAANEENTDHAAIEVEEGKKQGEPPKVTVHTSKPTPSLTREKKPCGTSTCCMLAFDIIAVVSLFLMSIFFICGAAALQPGGEPVGFFVVASLLFLTKASIEVHKRKFNGVLDIAFSSLGIGAGFFWFVASFFVKPSLESGPFGGLWIVGTMFNLTLITFDIVMVYRSPANYLFHAIALALEWLANLMFMAGAAKLLSSYESPFYASYCDYKDYAGLIISGAIMYFLYAIFYTLKLFLKGVTFTVQVSRSVPGSEE
mmetsp:Transcript_2831/g.4283  ORF Transcript_2831/g.4283 Transcript_2831/m.4283 type:complete len:291 (-) Transcript_2831:284-1156(-)|eukprot:CAMPEP_0197238390 /NCGR_PEP_ID=MMETSP1429-20130617/4866_1 /TAXON_ID=49237 /ORGANISM="Chaetoceros  sp., Strain UNC1202" /LENGTH=290 /DNA_ID=CAMNT_0042697525 /DNA_START=39 /DNA_END=911 /DNA_ORIENTATION=-